MSTHLEDHSFSSEHFFRVLLSYRQIVSKGVPVAIGRYATNTYKPMCSNRSSSSSRMNSSSGPNKSRTSLSVTIFRG